MAEKRMFAKTIIDSDAFLDMPQSSQLLYFHLSMRADDEGFINNPKSIMRNVGCKDDDLKILAAKKFIIPFESGVVVIKHWKIHNYIQSDRFKPTKYQTEKALLGLDENKAYTQNPDAMLPECTQDVSSLDTQVRLDKISIDKISIDKDTGVIGGGNTSNFDVFWNKYPRKVGKEAARKAFAKVKVGLPVLLSAIEAQKTSAQWSKDNGQFIPYPATWLNRGEWDNEVEAPQKQPRPSAEEETERMRKIYDRIKNSKSENETDDETD